MPAVAWDIPGDETTAHFAGVLQANRLTGTFDDNGVHGTSGARLNAATEAGLREEIRRPLIWAIIDLVGG